MRLATAYGFEVVAEIRSLSAGQSSRCWTWARLLRPVFAIEILVCERCGGPRRILVLREEWERVPEHRAGGARSVVVLFGAIGSSG